MSTERDPLRIALEDLRGSALPFVVAPGLEQARRRVRRRVVLRTATVAALALGVVLALALVASLLPAKPPVLRPTPTPTPSLSTVASPTPAPSDTSASPDPSGTTGGAGTGVTSIDPRIDCDRQATITELYNYGYVSVGFSTTNPYCLTATAHFFWATYSISPTDGSGTLFATSSYTVDRNSGPVRFFISEPAPQCSAWFVVVGPGPAKGYLPASKLTHSLSWADAAYPGPGAMPAMQIHWDVRTCPPPPPSPTAPPSTSPSP